MAGIFLFYVALARVMDISEPGIMPAALPMVLIILSVIRICLCCAPANNWSGDGGSQRWRLYRNIPFLITGIMTVLYLTVLYRKWLLAVLVALSFFFYMVTVMGVKKKPELGMLMIPKTICYILLIASFL